MLAGIKVRSIPALRPSPASPSVVKVLAEIVLYPNLGQNTFFARVLECTPQTNLTRTGVFGSAAIKGNVMAELTGPQTELAELIVEVLNLEDIGVADIEPDAQLFDGGLGLDSIDALEIAVAIAQKYEVHLKAEDENTQAIFSTLRNLSAHIQADAALRQS